MTPKPQNQPPKIVTRFAKLVSHIMADYLTCPESLAGRHPLQDRLGVKLMLVLSRSPLYRQALLFRDFSEHGQQWLDMQLPGGDIEKITIESMHYVEAIFAKRLQQTAKRGSKPSNMHLLLLMLCRYSVDSCWSRTWIRRVRNASESLNNDGFFAETAVIIKKQCQNLKRLSQLALNNRDRFGWFYLVADENRVSLPDELSWFNIMDAAPAPLLVALRGAPWYFPLVERIMLVLNEQYALLRSCGIPPHEFDESLSIAKLRELKKLKRAAEHYLNTGICQSDFEAFRLAFEEAQVDRALAANTHVRLPIAGFEDFVDFCASQIGLLMLNPFCEFGFEVDEVKEEHVDKIDNVVQLQQFFESHQALFSPLEAFCFEQLLIEHRPFIGSDGIVNDVLFQRLLAQDSHYARVAQDNVIDVMIKKLTAKIDKVMVAEA